MGSSACDGDERLLSSAKRWYVLGEAESHLWLSTRCHDDSAAYHLDEYATTDDVTAECVLTIQCNVTG